MEYPQIPSSFAILPKMGKNWYWPVPDLAIYLWEQGTTNDLVMNINIYSMRVGGMRSGKFVIEHHHIILADSIENEKYLISMNCDDANWFGRSSK